MFLRFHSGNKGMILEFDNSKGWGRDLRAMDCSWISRYKEEDEKLRIISLMLYRQRQYKYLHT